MRQASGIALALVMGISVAAAGHTQSVKAAVDTQTADTGVVATTDTANQTTETTTIGKEPDQHQGFCQPGAESNRERRIKECRH